jgi:flagellar hook-associated protein 2
MSSISVPGIGSGLDINGLVTQLVAVERAPAQAQIDSQRSSARSRISALGNLNSALDGVQTAFAALSSGSAFNRRTATSGDTAVVAASAGSSAVPGRYAVEVGALASSQKLSSGAFATADTAVGTGTLTVKVGTVSSVLTIDSSGQSLTAIRDAINAAPDNPGVDATIVTGADGAHLILNARTSGSAGAIEVTSSGGGLAALTYVSGGPGNGLTQIDPAQDAQVTIDGIAVGSAGNTISDAIEGVTLNLLSAKPGTAIDITVAADRAAAVSAVGAFVSSYNALVGTSLQLASYNATTGSAGPLLGDSTLRAVRNDLSKALATRDNGAAFESLSAIGVRVALNGALSVDNAALTEALDSSQASVAALVSEDGVLGQALAGVFDRFLGSDGVLVTRSESLNDTQRALDRQQERLDLRLTATETRLRAQFTALDSLLSRLQSTSNFLTQQLSSANSSSG